MILVRSVFTISGDIAPDEPGIDLAQGLVIHFEPFQLKWSEIAEEDIGLGHHFIHNGPAVFIIEVKGNAPFVAVKLLPVVIKVGRIGTSSRIRLGFLKTPPKISSNRVLDMDDVRPEIAEVTGGDRNSRHL